MTRNYVPSKKLKLSDLDLNSELRVFDLAARSKRVEAIGVADYRSERGEVVAALVTAAATAANDEVSLGYAERMRACADRRNFYYGEDFFDPLTGELFAGFGNLFGCGLKLCQSCTARSAARNRRIARQVVQNTELLNREHYCFVKYTYIVEREKYRFVTFTMPKLDCSLVKAMQILKRAWDLFRKLKFTKTYFSSIIKSVEFTVRKVNGTYHAHIHLLAITFFIPEDLIKMYWTDCVEKAFNEFGIEFEADQANVNLKLVDNLDKAINEICKYITKTETWENIPSDHLLEIARIRRWDRMFEISGGFRQTIQRLNAERSSVSSFVGDEAPLKGTENHGEHYFNTDGITDGEASETLGCSEETAAKLDEILKKPRRDSWRDIIECDGLEKYLEIFYRQVGYAQKIRKLRLILKFPTATFSDLDGQPWDLAEIEQFALQLAARGVEVLPT
jgi:hypothetical protein